MRSNGGGWEAAGQERSAQIGTQVYCLHDDQLIGHDWEGTPGGQARYRPPVS